MGKEKNVRLPENMIGKGNTAEVFEYGEGKVCKLFLEGYPREYVELEYNNAREVYKLSISVPRPYEIVAINNRSGILYERIEGKTLWDKMYEDEKNRDTIPDMFVDLHYEWLNHKLKNVLSYKEFLIAMVKMKSPVDRKLMDEIDALPDGDCLLHGDFHPNNILIKPDNTPIVIDFLNVCKGTDYYDIARTFYLLKQSNDLVANSYLKKMNILEEDIVEYIRIIEKCREYEG